MASETSIFDPMNVTIKQDDGDTRSSGPDPGFNPAWSRLDQLRWHAGVIRARTGVTVRFNDGAVLSGPDYRYEWPWIVGVTTENVSTSVFDYELDAWLRAFEIGVSAAQEPLVALDMVNHPPHYRHPSGLECITFTRHLTFDAGNAFKYVWRADAKNGRQDLEKARWHLLDAIEHADGCFLRSWNLTVQRQLAVVVEHETDRDRRVFFEAFERGDLGRALDAVNSMLGIG